MSVLIRLRVGMLTDDSRHAGTDSRIVLIIKEAGSRHDVLHYTFPDTAQRDQERGQANLYEVNRDEFIHLFSPGVIDTEKLDSSSFRVGIRGNDLWRPKSFVIWGEDDEGAIIPLAIDTNLQPQGTFGPPGAVTLSTDASEGKLSFPLPRVGLGSASTPIRRLLMLMTTADEDHAGTNDEFELQITTSDGRLVVDHTSTDTPQDDQERAQANLYFVPVRIPFNRSELNADSIRLRINGDDKWLPASFFLFGLDTDEGEPEFLVTLVHLRTWPFGGLSTDSEEGVESVRLPLL